jgi:shikimate kinase
VEPAVPREHQPKIHNLTAAVENVFLIGYRGTGKTTIAPVLAEKLGYTWVDADRALEERCGRSVRTIFAEEGEAGFRDKEGALLEELGTNVGQVIATGGGIILREANRQLLRKTGRAIWLTADAPTIWQRLQTDPATAEQRPNLSVGGLAEIEAMLRIRGPLYAGLADLTVDTVGRSPVEIVDVILEEWVRKR